MRKVVLLLGILVLSACNSNAQAETIAQTQTAVSKTQTEVSIDQTAIEQTKEASTGKEGALDDTGMQPTANSAAYQEQSSDMENAIAQTRHFMGDPDAPVVILEFSDFQ
jgi:hypothetical protein